MQLVAVIIVFAIVLALCMAGLGISMLLRKNGKFPETEVGSNKNMRKLGITCAKQDEMRKWKKAKRKTTTKEHDCANCEGCGLV